MLTPETKIFCIKRYPNGYEILTEFPLESVLTNTKTEESVAVHESYDPQEALDCLINGLGYTIVNEFGTFFIFGPTLQECHRMKNSVLGDWD